MKALLLNNKVVQIEAEEFPVAPILMWVECPDNCQVGWIYNPQTQEFAPEPIPEKTPDEVLEEYRQALQGHVNSVAREKDYENALSCASYVVSTNEVWKAEAEAFIAWRDSVWLYVLGELPKFENGDRPLIPVDEFILELPVLMWPN